MNYETATIFLFVLAGTFFLIAFAFLFHALWLWRQLRRELARAGQRYIQLHTRDLNGRPYRERL